MASHILISSKSQAVQCSSTALIVLPLLCFDDCSCSAVCIRRWCLAHCWTSIWRCCFVRCYIHAACMTACVPVCVCLSPSLCVFLNIAWVMSCLRVIIKNKHMELWIATHLSFIIHWKDNFVLFHIISHLKFFTWVFLIHLKILCNFLNRWNDMKMNNQKYWLANS